MVSAEWLAGQVRLYAGVIKRARDRQRRRRSRAALIGLSAAVAAMGAVVLSRGEDANRGHDRVGHGSATTVVRRLTRGRDDATFGLREPAGVVLLARVSAPRGVHAVVNATIPGIAGVPMGTTPDRFGRNPTCAVHHGTNVCTEAVQWCPMPRATWRFHVTKTAGPAGNLRVDFIVGPKPRHSSSTAQ